jgi:Methyltransferase domain
VILNKHPGLDTHELVIRTFTLAIGRKPTDDELAYGLRQAEAANLLIYLAELLDCPEARQNTPVRAEAPLFVPPGHYYSPVVNVHEYERTRPPRPVETQFHGISFNETAQLANFRSLGAHLNTIDFPTQPSKDFRYYFENDFYSYGDALVLSAFVQALLPRRIVEVGSGYSSAVILDTLDRLEPSRNHTACTFIEPHPERLKSLLRPVDFQRVTIIERPVQDVDINIFTELEAGDLVFFDTTHVLKTGSDVHHNLFQILPALAPGVVIHFHDVFDGFEYPKAWIVRDNRSWNELYALRAFLMYNQKFEIVLMNDAIARRFSVEAGEISRNFMKNPGGGLYLRKLR